MKKFGFLISSLTLISAFLIWDQFYYWSGPLEFLKDDFTLYSTVAIFVFVAILNLLTWKYPQRFSPLWSQIGRNIKNKNFFITAILAGGLGALQFFNPYLLPPIVSSVIGTILCLLIIHTLFTETGPYKGFVGEFNYQKPNWAIRAFKKGGLKSFLTNLNKKFLVGLVLIAILTAGIFNFYNNRPQPKEPEKLSFSFYEPGPTRLSKSSNGEVKERIAELQIRFDKSVAPIELVGKSFSEDTPRLFPEIKGTWKWISDQLLSFTPSEKWILGEKYHFQLSNLKLPKRYTKAKTEDEFTIKELKINVDNKEFYEDPRDPKINKAIFTLSFNYPVDQKNLQESIVLKKIEYAKSSKEGDLLVDAAKVQAESPVKFKVIFDDLGYKAHIHTESLSIPKHSARVNLKLLPGIKSTFKGTSTDYQVDSYVDLPGMFDYFNIEDADLKIVENEKAVPEHVGVLQFSAGVYPSSLKGKIRLYELPKVMKVEGRKIRHWSEHTASALGMSRSELIERKPVFLENSQEFPKLHSFMFELKPSTYYILSIEKGIKSASGFVLADTFEKVIYASPFPKKLKLMHDGNILSLSGEKKLNIYSTNVREIEVEIGQLLGDQVQHILTQTNGDYANPRFRNEYQFSKENLAHFERTKIKVLHASDKKPSYSVLNFSKYLRRKIQGKKTQGIFFVKVKDTRNRGLTDQRLIVVSDLGVVMKMDVSGDHHFFVQSLSSGKPVANALIQIVGNNGLSMSSTMTDSRGYGEVPNLEKDISRPRYARGILIKKGEDLAYLKYKDFNTNLDNSRFMVGGISNSRAKDSLRGYLFSDRGIYRPGEEVRVGIIVKGGQWDKSLLGIPVDIVVTNSQGKSIVKKERVLTRKGLDDLIFNLRRGAPTGSYTAKVFNFYGNNRKHNRTLIGSVDFKVEEFLPDRLKISSIFNKTKSSGWISPEDLKAEVNLQNLFGFPASGNEVRAKYKITPVSLFFSKYRDFRFDNPTKSFSSYSEDLNNSQTDDSGNTAFNLPLEKFAKKVFRLSFFAEGFEKGSGRSVTAKTSALVSPYNYLIGLKSIDDYSYIKREDKRTVEFIAIDSDLNPISPKGLTIRFIEKKYVNVLTKRPNGSFGYESQLKKDVLYKKPFIIEKVAKKMVLDTSNAGDFIVQVRDDKENLFSSFEYTVIGARDLSRSLSRNAELKIKLNKKDYAQGDTIELEIRSAYVGRGLITIERDKVYDFVWFNQNQKTTTQRIVIPSNLEGNAYLNVTLLRSKDSDQIYTLPLSHGVEPFTISKDSRREEIDLSVKELYKPGQRVDVKYSTSSNSDVILYAVNEGILQFANYKKPNPLDYYFRKKSLEVNTYQILDRLLPEYGRAVRNLAPGGGYGALSEQLNPFNRKLKKPVAYWSGPLKAGPAKKTWSFRVPEHFNGSLKFFAVAVGKQTLGSQSEAAKVRADMILTPNVLTFAAPGDQFDIPVGVFNNIENKEKAHDITLKLSHSPSLSLIVPSQKMIKINVPARKDKTQSYSLKALTNLGNANLTFTANSSALENAITETMSIRPATAYSTDFKMGVMEDSKLEIPIKRKIYSQYAQGKIVLGLSPLALSEFLISYLDKNPYGCSEQLVSKAFPHLLSSLDDKKFKGEAQIYIEKTIQALRSRQNDDGSIKLYPSNIGHSIFATLYTLHFLIEADERGLKIDQRFKKRVAGFLKGSLKNLKDSYLLGYAIYLLTRTEVITTAYLSDINPIVEDIVAKIENKETLSKGDSLTLLHVASSYKLLMNEKKARELLRNFRLDLKTENYIDSYYNPIVKQMRLVGLLAKHFPKRAATIDPKKLMVLFKAQKRHFNTLSSSYTLLGLEDLRSFMNRGLSKNLVVKQAFVDDKGKFRFETIKGSKGKYKFSSSASKIVVESSDSTTLFWSFYHSGFSLPGSELKSRGIEVFKEILDKDGKAISNVGQGDIVTVKIKFRTTNDKSLRNTAIVDLLPAGFENILDREKDMSPQGALGYTSDFINVREDRIISYGKISKTMQEFSYKIKAVNTGTFQVPGTLVEDLYDQEHIALGKSSTIIVVK